MPEDAPPPNVKIYDRPVRTGPSPLIMVIVLLVIAIVGYFAYRMFVHPAAPQQHSSTHSIQLQTAFWQEVKVNGKQFPARVW